jgi:hypothetical protein
MMVRKIIPWLLAITLTLGLWPSLSSRAGRDEGESGKVEKKVEKKVGHGHKHEHARIKSASKKAKERDQLVHKRHSRVKKAKVEEPVEDAAPEAEEREEANERFFNSQRRERIIRCYAPTDQGSLPPGLQMQLNRTGHLPPGLEMQLHRNGHLPPGLERKLRPASPELMRCVGPLPPGTKLFTSGRDAVLMNERVGSMVDVLHGFYPGP